jgi:Protein of unknown function (DUF2846)
MTTSLVILLFASAFVLPSTASLVPASQANSVNSLGAPGCGPADLQFDVKTEGKQQAVPFPDAGKALVFFLQDDAKFGSRPRPTTRFGIDATWIGATHSNSYFYVSINPGEHHLCANWQNRVVLSIHTRSMAAAHFTAEAGQTYYFRARDVAITDHSGAVVSEPEVKLEPVDGDEAQVLMSSFAFDSSHPKK